MLLAAACFFLMSNRSGRSAITGQGATASPGESGQYCGSFGCHFSGAFDPIAKLTLLDKDSNQVQQYIPGEEYIVELDADLTGFPSGYGFQIVALNADDNSGVNGFTDNLPSRTRSLNIGDRQYIEQTNIIPSLPIHLDWIAPQEGSGNVRFYTALNAVNGNGNSAGDGADTSFLQVNEELMTSLQPGLSYDQTTVDIYPNPSSDVVHYSSNSSVRNIIIYSSDGKMIRKIAGDQTINIEDLQTGLYFLRFEFNKEASQIVRLSVH